MEKWVADKQMTNDLCNRTKRPLAVVRPMSRKSHKIGFGSFAIRRHCHVDVFFCCKFMRRKTLPFSVRTRRQCVRRPCRQNKEIEEWDRPKKISKSIILQHSNHERINIYWSLRVFFFLRHIAFLNAVVRRWAFLFSFFGRSTLLINPINHFLPLSTLFYFNFGWKYDSA